MGFIATYLTQASMNLNSQHIYEIKD